MNLCDLLVDPTEAIQRFLFSDSYCRICASLCKATRVANSLVFLATRLDYENLLYTQAEAIFDEGAAAEQDRELGLFLEHYWDSSSRSS